MLNTVIRCWLETVIYNVNERVSKGANSAARINGADKKYSRGMQSEYGDLTFLVVLYSKRSLKRVLPQTSLRVFE